MERDDYRPENMSTEEFNLFELCVYILVRIKFNPEGPEVQKFLSIQEQFERTFGASADLVMKRAFAVAEVRSKGVQTTPQSLQPDTPFSVN
jgi:hypothetical protein